MSYDKYRNYNSNSFGGITASQTSIKEQVLKDLDDTSDHIDKLEILDSFEAYIEREHNVVIATDLANLITNTIASSIGIIILDKIPPARPTMRGRIVEKEETNGNV